MKLAKRTVLAAAAISATAIVWWLASPSEAPAEGAATESPATVTDTVTTRTLEKSEEFKGTLGYGDKFPLPGAATGTITWAPEPGAVLKPGAELYRADNRPAFWAQGDIPMYRELAKGSKGADVEQLQRFLQEQGHLAADAEIDGNFQSVTRNAVKAWQADHGLEKTGRIDSNQLVFLPYETIRVASVPRVGDAASGGVLEVTAPDLFVTATIDARKKEAFEGTPNIEVKMAAGNTYEATVESITAVESVDPYAGQQYQIKLSLSSANDEKPGQVIVEVIDVLAEDVLAVPARALVALVEGGYAVEKAASDGSTAYVAVELGEFADGWVEVTGALADGDTVVVPE